MLKDLLAEVRACRVCEINLPLGPRPVLQCSTQSKILIAGQAPGSKVHASGIPFDDPSGKRLREWLGLSDEQFYDSDQIAILPMGFCYPGTGSSGDLPPRPECAALWRSRLLQQMKHLKMTVVLGQFAQKFHFPEHNASLTKLVRSWQDYWPDIVPLPHPSPRNNRWLKQNPWFEVDMLPELKSRVSEILSRKIHEH